MRRSWVRFPPWALAGRVRLACTDRQSGASTRGAKTERAPDPGGPGAAVVRLCRAIRDVVAVVEVDVGRGRTFQDVARLGRVTDPELRSRAEGTVESGRDGRVTGDRVRLRVTVHAVQPGLEAGHIRHGHRAGDGAVSRGVALD